MRRPTILIVDDDRSAVETFELMLRGNGFDVRVALDCEGGWTEIMRTVPDAIILDLRLGAVDSMDFLRQLRAASPAAATPVAMITGDYLVDDRVADDLCGLGARLHFKPLWEEDLVRIARGLVTMAPGESAGGRGWSAARSLKASADAVSQEAVRYDVHGPDDNR